MRISEGIEFRTRAATEADVKRGVRFRLFPKPPGMRDSDYTITRVASGTVYFTEVRDGGKRAGSGRSPTRKMGRDEWLKVARPLKHDDGDERTWSATETAEREAEAQEALAEAQREGERMHAAGVDPALAAALEAEVEAARVEVERLRRVEREVIDRVIAARPGVMEASLMMNNAEIGEARSARRDAQDVLKGLEARLQRARGEAPKLFAMGRALDDLLDGVEDWGWDPRRDA